MKNKLKVISVTILSFVFLLNTSFVWLKAAEMEQIHTWEMIEITMEAEMSYDNYYTDVLCWIELQGPDFSKRIYGFWDGGAFYKVRIVLTKEGNWSWKSGSNQPGDTGLNGLIGENAKS